MKLAKTVIVSGLLFSSVLGSVNVGSITAMAAENAQTSARALGPAGLPKPGDTSKPTPAPKPTPSVNMKSVNVQYYVNGSKVAKSVVGFKNVLKVREDISSVSFNDLKEIGNTSDYYVADAANYQIENNVIKVHLSVNTNEYKKINIAFVDENNVAIEFIDVYVNKNESYLMSANYTAPKKYKFVSMQKVKINEQGNVLFKVTKNQLVSVPSPAPTPNKPQTPTKPSKRPSAPRYTIQRVRITFVDQNSKDLVGYKQVTGKASFSTKIEAPKGYSFTNAKDATIKFDKKGNKDIKIFVKKMTSAPVKHEGIITTTNGSYKRLYTLEGKMITNRALGVNSKWYTDQYATINGEKMYRVATNEWVKASDVL